MTGSPKILHAAEAHEFFTDEQCFITEYSNSANDPELSIARARVRPGITTQWHCLHGLTERYCTGRGRDRQPARPAGLPGGCGHHPSRGQAAHPQYG